MYPLTHSGHAEAARVVAGDVHVAVLRAVQLAQEPVAGAAEAS